MKNLNQVLLSYIAGFLDGDGSIIAQIVQKGDMKWGFQIRLTVQFTQKLSRKIWLLKLKEDMKYGYIRERGTVCDYVITDTKCVYEVLKHLQPFLRMKQKQANLVITIIERLPLTKHSQDKFIEVLHLVDHVGDLNDSKNRIHTAMSVQNALLLRFSTPSLALYP